MALAPPATGSIGGRYHSWPEDRGTGLASRLALHKPPPRRFLMGGWGTQTRHCPPETAGHPGSTLGNTSRWLQIPSPTFRPGEQVPWPLRRWASARFPVPPKPAADVHPVDAHFGRLLLRHRPHPHSSRGLLSPPDRKRPALLIHLDVLARRVARRSHLRREADRPVVILDG